MPRIHWVYGERCLQIASNLVQVNVTFRCGMMAPVTFWLGGRKVRPYALAPWKPDDVIGPAVLKVLRGDFFCLPFGAESGSLHPHGVPANADWVDAGSEKSVLRMRLGLDSLTPGAEVKKTIKIQENETAIYIEHTVTGLDGAFNYGTHPILRIPRSGGPFTLSVSTFSTGLTCPQNIDGAGSGTRSAFATGQQFRKLTKVPKHGGGFISLQRQPHAPRCEDLVLLCSTGRIGWSALTLDGYVWICLRRIADYPSTILWLSNGGREDRPWNGRHTRRIGIEDVCSYFHLGLKAARNNPLRKAGTPTARRFSKSTPVVLRNLHVAVSVPENFGIVKSARLEKHRLILTGKNGIKVTTGVDGTFLTEGLS